MRYYVPKSQMKDWEDICNAFAKRVGAKLVFVNDTSCGIEFDNGSFKHILVDEMQEYLKNVDNA